MTALIFFDSAAAQCTSFGVRFVRNTAQFLSNYVLEINNKLITNGLVQSMVRWHDGR